MSDDGVSTGAPGGVIGSELEGSADGAADAEEFQRFLRERAAKKAREEAERRVVTERAEQERQAKLKAEAECRAAEARARDEAAARAAAAAAAAIAAERAKYEHISLGTSQVLLVQASLLVDLELLPDDAYIDLQPLQTPPLHVWHPQLAAVEPPTDEALQADPALYEKWRCSVDEQRVVSQHVYAGECVWLSKDIQAGAQMLNSILLCTWTLQCFLYLDNDEQIRSRWNACAISRFRDNWDRGCKQAWQCPTPEQRSKIEHFGNNPSIIARDREFEAIARREHEAAKQRVTARNAERVNAVPQVLAKALEWFQDR